MGALTPFIGNYKNQFTIETGKVQVSRSYTFPKRLGAATKEIKGREFWFQIAFFSLNPFL